MNKFYLTEPLTDSLINQINKEAENGIIIVFRNTKGLKIRDLQKLDPRVTISITGGLNPKKDKFNDEHYQKRTYYSPSELIRIISVFETIERKINPLWNDLEKMMFVYKSICEYSNYSECTFNNRDAARNLLGLITAKSVCSGYAIIFKEAMDRLGIKCEYQNRQGHHSWNIVEIDGNYHAIELTWDTANKRNNECKFKYFCRCNQKDFYEDRHHNIDYEKEEIKYPIKEIPVETLIKTLEKILIPKVYKQATEMENGLEVATVKGRKIVINGDTPYLMENGTLNTYVRRDGSSFLVFPTGVSLKGVNEFVVVKYSHQDKVIAATKIYSEMDLVSSDQILRENISNN